MFQTLELLDALKLKRTLNSDYELAKFLHLKPQRIYQLRNHGGTISDDVAIHVANELEISPIAVLASMHAQRANCESVRSIWATLANNTDPDNLLNHE